LCKNLSVAGDHCGLVFTKVGAAKQTVARAAGRRFVLTTAMPILLYGVTQSTETASVATGVGGAEVRSEEIAGLRIYWSEMPDAEMCLSSPECARTSLSQFQKVLREILVLTTPIPFAFPTLLQDVDALQERLTADREFYCATLERVGNAVQYIITASWTTEEQADLATPVSGREYRKRREESMARMEAIDKKLKNVTGNSVSEWRDRQDRRTHRWFALVPRECRESFLATLRAAGPSEGVRLRLSGPWPPDEFIASPDASR